MLWVGITTSTYSSSYDFMSFTRFTIHELIQSYVIRVIVEFPFLGSTRSQGGECHEK